jgi:hypothetical protein
VKLGAAMKEVGVIIENAVDGEEKLIHAIQTRNIMEEVLINCHTTITMVHFQR